MRCDNCGWMNPEGVENCQKCNQKLKVSQIEAPKVVQAPKPEPEPVVAPAVINCDKCGREYSMQMPSCPNCGFSNPKFQECSEPEPAPKAFDMNKTVAFGAGMAAAPKSAPAEVAPFGVQDKSELKKTMVAGRETPAAPAKIAPFGVQDKSELKKTMVAGRETPAAPAEIAPFGVQDKSELKKTMVVGREAPAAPAEVNPFASLDKSELKKTIAVGDFNALQASAKAAALQQTVVDAAEKKEEGFKYNLQSMDHGTQDAVVMTITTSAEICLKKDDVILVAGMRYRVI